MNRLTVFILFCAVTLLSRNMEATPCSDLAHSKSFSFSPIVELETVVSGEAAFSHVLHERDPVKCFREIVRNGTTEAKMYALVALREIDRAEFQLRMKQLSRQHFNVIVLATKESGVIKRESGQTILKNIRDGRGRFYFEFFRKHLVSD